MLTPGNPRSPDAPRPASLRNARALRELLRQGGHELRIDADGHLVIDPPNPELLAGAQPWLKHYRAQLIDLVRFDALLLGDPAEGEQA